VTAAQVEVAVVFCLKLTHYDELLGIPSLPFPIISLAAGAVMML